MNKRKIRSTALSKAFSSIPTCGYVDRRDNVDHHVRDKGAMNCGKTHIYTTVSDGHSSGIKALEVLMAVPDP